MELATAHDVLAKLPQCDYNVWYRGQQWTAWCDDLPDALCTGTFEQAVIALAERYLSTAIATDSRESGDASVERTQPS
jgi:hypothetical protein